MLTPLPGNISSAELTDLIHKDLAVMYPVLEDKFSIAIHDVASSILSVFDEKLAERALQSFLREGVEVKTKSHIQSVEPGVIYTAEDGAVRYGMLIWATGNKQVPLVDTLPLQKSKGLPRLIVDEFLHPLDSQGASIASAYAIGDAANISEHPLPTTAEVACQMGSYLAKTFNHDDTRTPFPIQKVGIVAYTGAHDGVAQGARAWTGNSAWLAWRKKNLTWSRSWRNKILITMNWSLDQVFGKEMARA